MQALRDNNITRQTTASIASASKPTIKEHKKKRTKAKAKDGGHTPPERGKKDAIEIANRTHKRPRTPRDMRAANRRQKGIGNEQPHTQAMPGKARAEAKIMTRPRPRLPSIGQHNS
jgi:hypothetical protein